MEQLMQSLGFNPVTIVLLVALILIMTPYLLVNLSKVVEAFDTLHERFIKRKENRIISAAMSGNEEVINAIQAQIKESREEHDVFREHLDNDNRRINNLEREVDSIRSRADGHESRLNRHDEQIEAERESRSKTEKVMIKSMKTVLGQKIGLAGDQDIIDAVNEIDDFLLERKEM